MKPMRAIVTGGATNIGLAITESLLARGARVVVSERKRGLPAEVAQRYGDRLMALPLDVGHPNLCRSFIDEAAGRLGGLDILVNNAAVTGAGAVRLLDEIDEAHVDLTLNVNIKGVVFCSQAAAPHLREA